MDLSRGSTSLDTSALVSYHSDPYQFRASTIDSSCLQFRNAKEYQHASPLAAKELPKLGFVY